MIKTLKRTQQNQEETIKQVKKTGQDFISKIGQ